MTIIKPKETILQKFRSCVKRNIYNILYLLLLAILTRYIICNWNACISMQFFSHFDGNNILFLVWIALIILFFYDIEAKGFKFHRKENPEKELQESATTHAQEKMILDRKTIVEQELNNSDIREDGK